MTHVTAPGPMANPITYKITKKRRWDEIERWWEMRLRWYGRWDGWDWKRPAKTDMNPLPSSMRAVPRIERATKEIMLPPNMSIFLPHLSTNMDETIVMITLTAATLKVPIISFQKRDQTINWLIDYPTSSTPAYPKMVVE